ESQVNSESRRAWTREASAFLHERYQQGSGIFTTSGDMMGVYRESGIPLRETLNDGNEPIWMAATKRPDLFLREHWVLAFSGDPVSRAVQGSPFKPGPHYDLVKSIIVKNSPVVEIYRRHDTVRSPDAATRETKAAEGKAPEEDNESDER